jgi:hypothetical protein
MFEIEVDFFQDGIAFSGFSEALGADVGFESGFGGSIHFLGGGIHVFKETQKVS